MENARIEWKISRMKWKTTFHTSIPIPHYITHMAFTEKYTRIGSRLVITQNMWTRLAANHLATD